MKTASKLVAAATFALVLTSCAGGQRGPRFKPGVINRALATAPGEAQPSAVVATEVAMAQAEKEEGVWKARARFAMPNAISHLPSGPVQAIPTLSGLKELGGTAEWSTRTVIMSCDGALAVAQGRFRDTEGKFGSYVTTWVRQSDNIYKWSYNVDWIDNPQPPPRREIEDGEIVVTSIDAVQGLVASCPERGSQVPPAPPIPIGDAQPGDAQLSKDGTLQWRWEHRPDGTKHVVVDYFYEGEWVKALDEGLASPS